MDTRRFSVSACRTTPLAPTAIVLGALARSMQQETHLQRLRADSEHKSWATCITSETWTRSLHSRATSSLSAKPTVVTLGAQIGQTMIKCTPQTLGTTTSTTNSVCVRNATLHSHTIVLRQGRAEPSTAAMYEMLAHGSRPSLRDSQHRTCSPAAPL